jgi:uncharacterized Tic20 family protein
MADAQQPVEPDVNEPSAAGGTEPPEARTFAMLCHLSALSGLIGIPFGHIIGPLVFWLVKREEFPLVNDQGKEALNFQISMTIYAAVGMVLSMVLMIILIGFFLMILLVVGVYVVEIVFVIMAAMAANKGRCYRYPITIRFLK